jgi:hypothetical protein
MFYNPEQIKLMSTDTVCTVLNVQTHLLNQYSDFVNRLHMYSENFEKPEQLQEAIRVFLVNVLDTDTEEYSQ